MNRIIGRAVPAVLVAAACVSTLRADDKPSSIDQLAPENSVLVIGANNFGASMERLKSTKLWAFWESPDGKPLRDKFEEGMKETLEQMATELDMELEEFPMPTGAAGFAYFTVENSDTGAVRPAILAYADFGDKAEQMYTILQKVLDRGVEEGAITIETVTRVDREGWRAEFTQKQADDQPQEQADGEDDWMNEAAAPAKPPFDAIEFIKEGSMLMICTDQDALEQALHARDGEDIQSVADRDDHKAIKQRLGEGEIYGALLMRDFWTALGAMQGEDGGGMMMFIGPMIEQVVGKVAGAGWTVALGGSNAMVEQTWFVHMPQGKTGLTSLVGAESARPRVPSFVSPETTSYFTVNIDTAAIGPFVRQMLRNPMMGGQLDQQTMEDIEKRVTEVFATMGSDLHIASRIVKPLTANSQRTIIAMKCEKPQEFENILAREAEGMGFERRDFLGQAIYTIDPMGSGVPEQTWSVGIGGGYVIIGPSPDVELALRAAGDAHAESLETASEFQRAAQAFGGGKGIGWAFANIVDTIDSGMRMQIIAQRQSAEELREWAPEYADEMLKQVAEMEEKLKMMPSAEVMRRYIGPTASVFQSVEDGFVGKSFIMPGGEE